MKEENIRIFKPKKKKSIKEALALPREETVQKTAKISQDLRGQFFVRFPAEIAETLKITTNDKVKFFVKAPIPLKNKNQIKYAISIERGKA